ncbi:Uncharacterized SAM-binding protein YcdF, DUF218 family [Arboricoccus pini]|uniref:Uncharacterized SAM-binding protein YcdF, DUF218 family n=1 Tax=Arboricoccus pini TaxID=1963835 RepID=A0A212S0T1_9PROT|nr:YdcF family protein [Arboricoccus pini]SNB78689.1 Uncharacterized SAM-binding protein YcdF, DUF218 family [Arboricoccus pini]
MEFIAGKLLWAVMKPSVFMLVLGLLGWILLLSRKRRSGVTLIALSFCYYLLVLALPVDIYAARPLENRFPHPDMPPATFTGIIALGGSMDLRLSADRRLPTLNQEAERLISFVDLARRYPQARLAFTGGSGAITSQPITEADVARAIFAQEGLGDRPVTYEDRSRNTYENARFLAAMIKPRPDETWLLVTSALHMPRSVACFRAAGWNVVAWPVAYKTPARGTAGMDLDFASKLWLVDAAAREWTGLIAYRLTGRTNELFPAP